ncbi:Smr/MutS family protein [Pleomorphovibrio marinus]|uniref:Smr/MutS family protein n=1 Tax=Pleomorphovibrio marinus TaxID=2164132 RepID=UPI000E0AB334|nr:DUF2027 domain-containing protein [Pleomorphovibrio marinus]
MNIGDRVRLLRGTEEGVITKLSPGGQVEIEIEEGFRIPALKSEVVLIHQAERDHFGTKEVKEEVWEPKVRRDSKDQAQFGVFLAYLPYNDQHHGVHLINNQEKDILFYVAETHGANSKTLSAGVLKSKQHQRIDERSIKDFESWPTLHFQFIPLNQRMEITLAPFERKVKFKASAFFKSKKKAPLMEKEAYVFQLNEHTKPLDIKALNQSLNEEEPHVVSSGTSSRPPAEVDLHIEKIEPNHQQLSNSEKLRLQLEAFEKNINLAIVSGSDEITFIHGIGNGVLRREIHKRLSGLKHIEYFQDAHKSNFGYGATRVKIQ